MPEGGEGNELARVDAGQAERLSIDRQQQRRDYQLRLTAHTAEISLEALATEPLVQGFVTVLHDTEDLQWNFSNGARGRWDRIEEVQQHPLGNRYNFCRALTEASLGMLGEGIKLGMLAHKDLRPYDLSYLEDYGYELRPTSELWANEERWGKPPLPPQEGPWRDSQTSDQLLLPPDGSMMSNIRWWNYRVDPDELPTTITWSAPEVLPEDREQGYARCEEEAQRLGIPAEDLQDREVLNFLYQLSTARRLLAEEERTLRVENDLPGMTPSAIERVRAASHLTRAMIMVMEDGFHGQAIDEEKLAAEIAAAYKGYDHEVVPFSLDPNAMIRPQQPELGYDEDPSTS
ncbi:hypothetical protein ACPC54_36855 [Kitasatospora sp. NPDC094028]